jgi:hypothetical protein
VVKHKVEVKYATGEGEEISIEDGTIKDHSGTYPNQKMFERQLLMEIVSKGVKWLAENGGTSIEIKELP